MNTKERLSVLETKVDELTTQSDKLDKKVDILIDLVNKGNFDQRICTLEKKDNLMIKWIVPIFYTAVGAVVTFLLIDFLNHI